MSKFSYSKDVIFIDVYTDAGAFRFNKLGQFQESLNDSPEEPPSETETPAFDPDESRKLTQEMVNKARKEAFKNPKRTCRSRFAQSR